MKQFVAYHNTDKEGYPFDMRESDFEDGGCCFWTKKRRAYLENQVLGNNVWTISGEYGEDGKKAYELHGCYVAEEIEESDDEEGKFLVRGDEGIVLDPSVKLNGLSWFDDLLRVQNHFSLGLNEIKQQ